MMSSYALLMQHSRSRWRLTSLVRLAGSLGAVLVVVAACGGDDDDDSVSATAGSGGTSGATSGTTSAGGNGGGGGSGGSGGAGAECTVSPIATECFDDIADEQCYTLEELSDPCSGTHLWLVHQGSAGAGGAGGALVGDGGTDERPSAEELFWGDVGERCGCFDTPACETPTVQRGGQCCYRVQRSCRLC